MVGAAALLNAVEATNRYLIDIHPKQGYFATLFFGVLDPVSGSLVYVNCGHNAPLVLAADGTPRAELTPTGPAVGVLPGGRFSVGHQWLAPGESLFAFTDGVTEAHAADGELFGDSRLLDLACSPVLSARGLLDRVSAAIDGHVGAAEQFDDITMMAVLRPDEAGAAEGNHQ
jgi:sigma-B regulation protein RsbU (phosphoserine phosphatase)